MSRNTVARLSSAALPIAIVCGALTFGASVALALCPTAEDLSQGGVRAVFADGLHVDYRRVEGDMVEIFEARDDQDTDGVVYTSKFGLYELAVTEVAGGHRNPDTRIVVSYSEQPDRLPEPRTGDYWLGSVETSWPDGAPESETGVYVFGAGGVRNIGGCAFEVIPVKASFFDDDRWMMQDFIYFPALPVAVLTALQISGMENPKGRGLARLERIDP